MDPVFNERVKLGATMLNTLATASVTVGVLAHWPRSFTDSA